MTASDSFSDFTPATDQLRKRAREMRRSANRQRGMLLGAGIASFGACSIMLLGLAGPRAFLEALVAMGMGAFGGVLFMAFGSLRLARTGAESLLTALMVLAMLLAGALLGAMVGLVIHVISKLPDDILWVGGSTIGAGVAGGIIGRVWASRNETEEER